MHVAARAGHPAVLDRVGGRRLLAGDRQHDRRRRRGGSPAGSSAFDQASSTVPSGRAVAPRTTPRRGVQLLQRAGRPGRSGTARCGRRGRGRPAAPSRRGTSSRHVAGQVEHDLGLGVGARRPRSAAPRGRGARGRPAAGGRRAAGANSSACRPRPSPSHFSATDGVVVRSGARAAPGSAGRRARSATMTSSASSRVSASTEAGVGVPVDRPAARRRTAPATARCRRRSSGRRRPRRAADLEPRRVGRLRPRARRRVSGPPANGWVMPDAELVAVGVGEPPDRLAVGAERAHQRAVGPVGDLAVLAGLAVPGVLLDDAADVGGVEVAVRGVLRPLRQGDPRRAEPGLPAGGDLGGEGGGVWGWLRRSRRPSSQAGRAGPETTQGPPSAAPEQCVGLTGFEPAASSSRTTRATKLRHSPTVPSTKSNAPGRRAAGGGAVRRSRAVSVSSVASGRQANRTGAYGQVPSPAETCSQVPRVRRESAG